MAHVSEHPSSSLLTNSADPADLAGRAGSHGLPVTGVAPRGYLKVISVCHQGLRVDWASGAMREQRRPPRRRVPVSRVPIPINKELPECLFDMSLGLLP